MKNGKEPDMTVHIELPDKTEEVGHEVSARVLTVL